MRYPVRMLLRTRNLIYLPLLGAWLCSAQPPAHHEDAQLDLTLQSIAAGHRGGLAVYAENLKTGETAGFAPDMPVQTASTIKMAVLLDAAEQVRAGHAKWDEKLVLQKQNQVPGSGVLAQLDTPLALTLKDVLTLMVIVSDNTATNLAIDRLGLAHIDRTIRDAGLKQTWLYKKVFMPASGPMPADQPKFGLGKTTPREMASIMARFAQCDLALGKDHPLPQDGEICGVVLHMLREQQDRDGLPRYIENLDTGDHGSAIANKTGALDGVRNDVALVASKAGPIVIAAFTFNNADQRWTGDNEGQKALGKVGQAVVERWSPQGLDADRFPWDKPAAAAAASTP
jgi:beta-lactamase class A